jgi:hypothetical protein
VSGEFLEAVQPVAFFIEWRDLHGAERVVHERLAEFVGRDYVTLGASAKPLAGRFPAAALLYRLMIESILGRASASQYGYAVRDVRNLESLAAQLPEGSDIEGTVPS